MKKKALVTGVSGQDGSYLSKLLLEKGYKVYGAARRSASNEHWRLKKLGILDQVEMVPFELLEYSNIERALKKIQPDEIYNLAAMSFVGASFDQPVYTGDTNGLGVVRVLEAIRNVCPQAKMYQASTSEMFGSSYSTETNYNIPVKGYVVPPEFHQDENTPFHPRSPYGCAKLFAHTMVTNYREAYDMFCCSGILFNHESPLRGEEFVTRKITLAMANIMHGKQEVLELGNMEARRDWGHAEDYVRGMWMMLQQDKPDDYVLATGQTRSVKDFVDAAAKALGWPKLGWRGQGADMEAYHEGIRVVKVNPEFYRPSDVEYLCGSPDKAKNNLGWVPLYTFEELVASMVESDLTKVLDE